MVLSFGLILLIAAKDKSYFSKLSTNMIRRGVTGEMLLHRFA
jgi:hypothetical protein